MTKLALASIVVVLLSAAGCSASPTRTFEQQRAAVVGYLRALNRIDNDLNDVTSAVTWPQNYQYYQYGTAAALLQLNSALTQFATASQGALKRLDEVKVPELAEAHTHLEGYRNALGQMITATQKCQAAISAGNAVAIQAAFNDLTTAGTKKSAVNRATEALLLKYNIPILRWTTNSEGSRSNRGPRFPRFPYGGTQIWL